MKRIVLYLIAMTALFCTFAFAEIKPCDELKAEIDAKLKEKGVNGYTLEVVPVDKVKDQKVVGSCEGGKKKITYLRQ